MKKNNSYSDIQKIKVQVNTYKVCLSILLGIIIFAASIFYLHSESSLSGLFQPLDNPSMYFYVIGLLCLIFSGLIMCMIHRLKDTKERLRQSEFKYHNIYHNLNDVYYEVTMDGIILDISPSIKDVLGYDPLTLMGKNIGQLYVDRSTRRNMILTILEHKEVKNYEVLVRDSNGNQHYIWLHAKLMEDNKGSRKIIGMFRDVTQYRQAKEKQELSEKRYRLLYNKMRNGFFVVEPVFNEAGKVVDIRFLDVNPSFEEQTGKKASEFIGKTWLEVFGFNNFNIFIYEKVYYSGQPHSFQSYHSNLSKDYYNANIFKLTEDQIGVIFDNITEIMEAKIKQEESEAKYRLLFDKTMNGILVWEPIYNKDHEMEDVIFVDINPNFEKLTGLKAKDILGRTWFDIFGYKNRYMKEYERVLQEDGYCQFENYNPVLQQYFMTGIFKINEHRIGAVFENITERKTALNEIHKLNTELEQRVTDRTLELKDAVNELEAFAYTVSHDLKSPLRAIDAYSRIMLEDYPMQLEGEMKDIIGNIKNISSDMINMINKLLQFSTTAKHELHKERIDIREMMEQAFRTLSLASPSRKLTLIIESELPSVKADRVLMRLVIENILSNAVKFTRPCDEALIKVSYEKRSGIVIYTIKDNGVGFDKEYAGKLFNIFERLHSSDEFEGAGIGLATVRKIIQIHGGTVLIEGNTGDGASVSFALPDNTRQEAGVEV